MSQGGPTRCKLGHLFKSWSELVVTPLVGMAGLDNRAPRDRYPPVTELGIVLCAPFTLGVKLGCFSRASAYQLAFNSAKTSPVMLFLKPLIFEATLFLLLALEI